MRNCTYFISDLHLGAGYIADPKAHERLVAGWLRSIAPTARALYLLGDVMDYWYEYRTVAPRGHLRFLGALAQLADSGTEIVWLKGNHDVWLFDYLRNEIGLEVADGVVDRVIDGRRFVMEHGDGAGEDRRSYRFLRSLFRSRFAQRLYSAIHPRWTVGFAFAWSKHSRLNGRPASTSSTLKDDDLLVRFARDYMREHGHVDYFVFGHRHSLVDMDVADDTRLIVLGEAFSMMTYGVWDGKSFSLKKIQHENRTDSDV